MSFEDSEKKPKRPKQLSIFDVFAQTSKKRKQSTTPESLPQKRLSLPQKIPLGESSLKGSSDQKSMSSDVVSIGEASEETIIISDDSQKVEEITEPNGKSDASQAKDLNKKNISHIQDVNSVNVKADHDDCVDVNIQASVPDKRTDMVSDTSTNAHTCDTDAGGDTSISSFRGAGGEATKVLDDNRNLLKKEFGPGLSKKAPLHGLKRNPSDSPSHSQDSDDLYEAIMRSKREANTKYLNTELKEDSDLSQGTPPPKPVFTKPIITEPEPEVMNIYDSPDIFESTFPSQDFDADFEEKNCTPKWLGKPKSRLKVASDCLPPLPELKQSVNHTVLFDTLCHDLGPPRTKSSAYQDAWDSQHVKLPCSPKSLFPTRSKSLTNRWELIETALLNDISSFAQLEEAILHYNRFPPSFRALSTFLSDMMEPEEKRVFFSQTLPKMVNLALLLPTIITQAIPLLRRQHAHCLTLSQQQIACLLANAFFCTFPRRNSSGPNSEYATFPSINFNRLFVGCKSKRDDSHMEKLKTLFHYFKRVTSEMPSGVVTFERRVASSFPVWNRSPCEFCELHISKVGLIEDDSKGMLQMDFANKYVGGGVLGGGMVQEEILFCIFPELIVSRLFTEVLDDNECLIVTGAERYSCYCGYAETYKWEGDYKDQSSIDSWKRKQTSIVALDATPFWKNSTQYRPGNVRRELNKLYCGFWCDVDSDLSPAIATGNWGCGAFGGDPILKALLQLMAAAVVGRDLCYFTFNDDYLMNTIYEMYTFIRSSDLRVCDVWNQISKYNEEEVMISEMQKCRVSENIFEFMQRLHKDYQTSTDEGDSSPEKIPE